jgi:hypothetical protein
MGSVSEFLGRGMPRRVPARCFASVDGVTVLVVPGDAVQAALRDAVSPADWLDVRCRGCELRLLLPSRDLAAFVGVYGWPGAIECPKCWRRRVRQERDREWALNRLSRRIGDACSTMDSTDAAQTALLAAVPRVLAFGPMELRELFPAVRRVAKSWRMDPDMLLRAVAYAVERGYDADDLLKMTRQEVED